MKTLNKILFIATLLTVPSLVRAEDTTRSNSTPMSSLDRIKNRKEMHQNQIDKINAYLKERESIPANNRVEADNKFLSTLKGGPKDHKKAAGAKKERKRRPAAENINPYSN